MAEHEGDQAFCFKAFAEKVWNAHKTSFDTNLNKAQTKVYFTEICQKMDKEFDMTEDAFEQLFKMIDVNSDHAVCMGEMVTFLENFTNGKQQS